MLLSRLRHFVFYPSIPSVKMTFEYHPLPSYESPTPSEYNASSTTSLIQASPPHYSIDMPETSKASKTSGHGTMVPSMHPIGQDVSNNNASTSNTATTSNTASTSNEANTSDTSTPTQSYSVETRAAGAIAIFIVIATLTTFGMAICLTAWVRFINGASWTSLVSIDRVKKRCNASLYANQDTDS
jgi:hypothetical protein